MAKAKKKPLTREQQLKRLTRERVDIVKTLEAIQKRSASEVARVERQTTKFKAQLAEVDAKIAAIPPPPADEPVNDEPVPA